MKIEVTNAFCIAGERQEVGSVLDVDARFAAELIHNHKAVAVVQQAEAPAEKPAKRASSAKEKSE